jgi:hypothetical protein
MSGGWAPDGEVHEQIASSIADERRADGGDRRDRSATPAAGDVSGM